MLARRRLCSASYVCGMSIALSFVLCLIIVTCPTPDTAGEEPALTRTTPVEDPFMPYVVSETVPLHSRDTVDSRTYLSSDVAIVADGTVDCVSFKPVSSVPTVSNPVCILTAPRPHGTEYLSWTLQSFLAATRSHSVAYVIMSDHHNGVVNSINMLKSRCEGQNSNAPVVFLTRSAAATAEIREPYRSTLNDTMDRMRWRTREVQDYAFGLRTCLEVAAPGAEFITVVQDDIAFSASGMSDLEAWLDAAQERPDRWLAASLWDQYQMADGFPHMHDGAVAKVFQIPYVEALANYLDAHWDELPVDLLMWQFADKRNPWEAQFSFIVRVPNPVEHCGRQSSFPGQVRSNKSATFKRNNDAPAEPCGPDSQGS